MKKKLKKLDLIFKFLFKQYYSKPRTYRYENIEVLVYPEVFPPHFTISTKILLDYIKPIDLKNKSFLELGCGSGIISLFAASKDATVLSSDINQIAIDALDKASIKNNIKVTTIYSDLFDSIRETHFDYIVINPPYYPKEPKNDKDKAWFCGENFEYFEKLFKQLIPYVENSQILMILSEDCNLQKIKTIATKNLLQMYCVVEKTVHHEKNYIYKILTKKLNVR